MFGEAAPSKGAQDRGNNRISNRGNGSAPAAYERRGITGIGAQRLAPAGHRGAIWSPELGEHRFLTHCRCWRTAGAAGGRGGTARPDHGRRRRHLGAPDQGDHRRALIGADAGGRPARLGGGVGRYDPDTADGGATWTPQTSRTGADLYSVQMLADGRRGWVVGSGGTILTTADGGATWMPQTSGTTANLSSVQMQADGQHGWVVGGGATLLNTRDGGKTWQEDIRYRRFPAPWYYLNWLLVAGLVAPALRQRAPPFALQTSVEDMLASDRPLEAGDPDPLQFQQIAAGLSRFLRNENTQPPLTIAISGEWGTGKSSLMNLLKADLIRRGFRPLWFNAWHHQKEEHLLATLLANIRTQAIPP